MADNAVTIRTRKFLFNPLLQRKQMVVDVIHPGRANVSKADLKEKIGKLFKVKDDACVLLFGFRTAYGGGKSTGFCNVYESVDAAKKFEKKHFLWRMNVTEMPTKKGRKGIKEAKNRAKKVRGTGRRAQIKAEKRSQQ